jgi:hypothetical protein
MHNDLGANKPSPTSSWTLRLTEHIPRLGQLILFQQSTLYLRTRRTDWSKDDPHSTPRLLTSLSIAVKFDGPRTEALSLMLGNSTGTTVIVELRDPTAEQHTLKRFMLPSGEIAELFSRGLKWVPSVHFLAIID